MFPLSTHKRTEKEDRGLCAARDPIETTRGEEMNGEN
jgi:hypothetical protein